MGKTKKAQVMFTCTHEVKDFLTQWAARENRTVSNLVETLVVDAIATQEGDILENEPIKKAMLSAQQDKPRRATGTGGKSRGKKGVKDE